MTFKWEVKTDLKRDLRVWGWGVIQGEACEFMNWANTILHAFVLHLSFIGAMVQPMLCLTVSMSTDKLNMTSGEILEKRWGCGGFRERHAN
jgi:hypothetical protein